jgi:hypothetical protein
MEIGQLSVLYDFCSIDINDNNLTELPKGIVNLINLKTVLVVEECTLTTANSY